MTYHLHTQDLPNVPTIVARHFDGATITHGTGLWHGSAEPAATIELASDDRAAVLRLAADLRVTNRQDAVLVESMPSTIIMDTAASQAARNDRSIKRAMPEWLKAIDPVGAYFEREADL